MQLAVQRECGSLVALSRWVLCFVRVEEIEEESSQNPGSGNAVRYTGLSWDIIPRGSNEVYAMMGLENQQPTAARHVQQSVREEGHQLMEAVHKSHIFTQRSWLEFYFTLYVTLAWPGLITQSDCTCSCYRAVLHSRCFTASSPSLLAFHTDNADSMN